MSTFSGTSGLAYTTARGSGDMWVGVPPISSGLIQSGYGIVRSGGSAFHPSTCCRCRKVLSFGMITDQVVVTGVSGLIQNFCWGCAGYRYQAGEFPPARQLHEEVLRHGVSDLMDADAPIGVVADRYEEMGLPLIAQYLRNRTESPVTSSR